MIEIITPEVEVYNIYKLIEKLQEMSPTGTHTELLTEYIGRVCYNSYDKMCEDSYIEFNNGAAKKGHRSIFEFNNHQLNIFADKLLLDMIQWQFIGIPFIKLHRQDDNMLCLYGSIRSFIELMERIVCGQTKFPSWFYHILYKVIEEHGSITSTWSTMAMLEDYMKMIPDKMPELDISFSEITASTHIKNDKFKKLLVRVVTDKGVHNELVRHRPMSYMAESQRYVRYGIGENAKNPMKVCIAKAHYLDEVYRNLVAKSSEESFNNYKTLLEANYPAQQARVALPVGTAMTYFMYGDIEEWNHIFSLRTAKTALPMAQEVIKEVRDQMVNKHLI